MRHYMPQHWLLPAICLLITLYFSYHAIHGARGLRRMAQVKVEIAQAIEFAEQTRQERDLLKRKVQSLSSESLDLDQLEESAWRVLNMGNPDDYIIFEK